MTYTLSVERTIDAPPERIFDGFIALYDSDRPDWVTGSRLDLRTGGRWDVSFQVPDGPAFREERVLTVLDRPRRLGYDMTAFYGPEPSLRTTVTVTVEPAGGGQRIRLEQDGFPDEGVRDDFAGAWPDVLDQLAERLV
jgi:uncharacterized protein YndB with AHSA1/START domain